jgi:polysaccharide export outer membrane protein
MRVLKIAALCALPVWPFVSTVGAQSPVSPNEYEIGPRDLLEIRVLEDSSLDREVRVTPRGTVELPHVGEIVVSGHTQQGAAEQIQQALEKYLQTASVSVEVIEFRSNPILVMGAVRNPGRLPFSGRWTLLDALTEAGGLAADAGDTIYIRRTSANGLSDQLAVSVSDLIQKMDPMVDVPVFSNDVINVERAHEIAIHCMGAVRSPGTVRFQSTERVTLATAIAKAGGTTENASSKLVVKRGDLRIPVNLKKILKGTEDDVALEEGDIIIVEESFF